MHTIIGLGELLWDIFPDGKVLGGAPANFAYHVHQLEQNGLPFSRIGADALGDEIMSFLESVRLCTGFIQRDNDHPTGQVHVKVDASGHPEFDIKEDVAWDYMEPERRWLDAARGADAICFGTLCQRNRRSRNTIGKMLDVASDSVLVFDVNLRGRYFSREIIVDSLEQCTLLKLNIHEQTTIQQLLDLPCPERDMALAIMDQYDIELVCITRGEEGCVVHTREDEVHSGVPQTEVVDTVGAGDAFCAGLTVKYLQDSPTEMVARGANLMGAYVAGQRGAMPEVPENLVAEFNSL